MNREQVKQPIRCAIYTRKSTEEGLEQEFNSLDAQRDAGEAFITSQRQRRLGMSSRRDTTTAVSPAATSNAPP